MGRTRALVTGATGHLGANLVRRLLAGGYSVRALVRPGAPTEAIDGLEIEQVTADIVDAAATRRAFADIEVVFHSAAKLSTVAGAEREIFECNVLGTRNVLDAARAERVRRVVVTGSFSAVGERHGPSDETVPFSPFDAKLPYEWTKSLVELEAWRAVASGLDVVVATSCAILGPNDYEPSRMGRTLADFANGRMSAYVPGGFQFVAARDICEGHVLCAEKGRSGQKYIFASQYLTVDELMGIYEDVTGKPRPPRMPAPLVFAVASVTSPLLTAFAPRVPQRLTPAAVRILQKRRRADTTKAQTELGFEPTGIRAAVQEAYEDFRRRGVIVSPPSRAVPEVTSRASAPASRAIPSVGYGFPGVGLPPAFLRSPGDFLIRAWRRHGEVFALPLLGKRVVAMLGPRAHEAFFRSGEQTLSPRALDRLTVPMSGTGVVDDAAPDFMRQELGFVLPGLKDDGGQGYVAAMYEEAESYFQTWGEDGEIDLLAAMNEVATRLTARCILGSEVHRKFARPFAVLNEDLEAGMNLVGFMSPRLPMAVDRKRDRARDEIGRMVAEAVEQRRASGRLEDHFLGTLTAARHADGRALSADEITGLVIALHFAGQRIAGTQATWGLALLLLQPEWLRPVLEEQRRTISGRGAWEMSRRMPFLERALMEAERLRPAIGTITRTVLRDFEFDGFTARRGDIAMISPAAAHRLPTVFRDPERYDPARFASPREEHKRAPYAFIAFGSGQHRSIGFNFAYLQMQVILSTLLRTFEVRLGPGSWEPDYATFVHGPKPPSKIRYRRLTKRTVASSGAIAANVIANRGAEAT